jgi:hypothetical protein
MPDVLRRTASTGFEVGDMVYGAYCLNASYRIEILLGTNLEALEVAMRSSYQKIRDLSRDGMDILVAVSHSICSELAMSRRVELARFVVVNGRDHG